MKFFKAVLFGLFLSVAAHAIAQTETFDMMTFKPPAGWERNQFEDKIVLRKADGSCAILIFRSRESSGSGETDFKNEWKERVAKQYNTTAEPKTPDVVPAEEGAGEVLISGATFESNGAKASALLFVYRTSKRAMSVLALNPNRCQAEFEDFTLTLEFSKNRELG